MRALLAAACFLSIGLLARQAVGHATDLSQSSFVLQSAGDLQATLVFARADAARIPLDPAAGAAAGAPLSAPNTSLLAREVAVSSDGVSCALLHAAAGFVEKDGLELTMRFDCPPPSRALRIDLPILKRMPPSHRHATRITTPRGSRDELLTAASASSRYAFAAEGEQVALPPAGQAFIAAVRVGFAHILTGWDHVLFLLALLLGLRGMRVLLAAATAFTVGHSITLALAALSLVAPASRIVEPAIGASIAYVAFENLRMGSPRHRWPIAFLFGLVHGFGFAAGLRGLSLARERLLPTLFGFNVGVEVGQALVVALGLPLVALVLKPRARDAPPNATRVRVASAVVGAAGVVVCVARLVAP